MREYLESIFNEELPRQFIGEECGLSSIASYLFKYQKNPVIIYGAGTTGFHCLKWLRRNRVEPLFIVDENVGLDGTDFYGVNVIHSEKLQTFTKAYDNIIALIAVISAWNIDTERMKIITMLKNAGCRDIISLYDKDAYPPIAVPYWPMQKYFFDNRNRFIEFLDNLADTESKEAYCEYIRAIIYEDLYRTENHNNLEKYWGNGLFINLPDEHIVNLGATYGDTVFKYLDNFSSFGSFHCVEGEAAIYEKLEYHLNILPENLRSKIFCHNCFIGDSDKDNQARLDKLLHGELVTLITFDIEGAELDSLKGAAKIIKSQEPVLAISIYHKQEDLLEIPAFIMSLSENYTFYLRKYFSSGLYVTKDEMVLYAIPKSRLAK